MKKNIAMLRQTKVGRPSRQSDKKTGIDINRLKAKTMRTRKLSIFRLTTFVNLAKLFISSFNCEIRNDLPLPHLAYKPTVMGVCREGSLNISARALLYKS